MKTLLAAPLALLALATVAGASPLRDHGATATFSLPSDDGCVYTSLQLYVSVDSSQDPATGWTSVEVVDGTSITRNVCSWAYAYEYVVDDTLVFDADLDGATATGTITLRDSYRGLERVLDVDLTWTPYGDTLHDGFLSVVRGGDHEHTIHIRTHAREATATGTVDGVALTSVYANVYEDQGTEVFQ